MQRVYNNAGYTCRSELLHACGDDIYNYMSKGHKNNYLLPQYFICKKYNLIYIWRISRNIK